ncbi:MAG: hypothetical protein IT293_15790 [Deltaproteobacteria bacterium]|nr:hypothetical protein [Deltaproteobacteria bacterium]
MRERLTLHGLWIATALTILVPSFADPDLWGHLIFGSSLLAGTLHLENTFAYTTPTQPWVNHEILAEGAMALAYRLAGSAGLVALKVTLGIATAAVLWRTARRRSGDALAATLAVVFALYVMRPGFMIRPQLFTMLFLAVALEVVGASGRRAVGGAWMLPLLVALWVNVHGGVLAGVGLAAIALTAARTTELWHGTLGVRDAGGSTLLLALTAAALAVNPYGLRLVAFLLRDVTPAVPITEWAPVGLLDASFPLFKLMLLIATVGTVMLRPALAETAVVAATAVVALRHQRHVPLFAIAAAPLVAATLVELGRRWVAAAGARISVVARAALAAAATMQAVFAILLAGAWRGEITVLPSHYPVQAVRFLVQNDIVGNVALPFSWGEYALWALPTGSRVAVDGRFTTAYPQDLLAAAWRFMTGEPGWDDLLNQYPTDVVIADRAHGSAEHLRGHPDWQYVYSDKVSFVFLRIGERHADALARFHAGRLVYDAKPFATTFPAADRSWAPPPRDARMAASAVVPPGRF